MSLSDEVREAFSPHGLLAGALEAYRPRQGQVDMALAVAQVIEAGGVLVAEAGTGIGKTFAYLVPALLSGSRLLISTATKTLQDQLFGRDLPLLIEALRIPVRTALLKGRSSYLCLHRLQLARESSPVSDSITLRTVARVEQWAQQTRSGDLAELPGLDERSAVIALVTSTRDNCLGAQCPQARTCHVNLARREALAADVVVINHHLFFADWAVRDSGMAELLPTVRTVILDEAHQLNETGVQFLGQQLSTGQVIDWARDILVCALQQARGLAAWQSLAAHAEQAARNLRMLAGRQKSSSKLRWTSRAPEHIDEKTWQEALGALSTVCATVVEALGALEETSPDLERLRERGVTLVGRIQFFLQPGANDAVRWVDVGTQLRLVESPLDIAEALRGRLAQDGVEDAPARSWVFTSATLGHDDSLRWFTEPCGLQQARILRVTSPFDYPRQAVLYVPRDLPRPNDAEHSQQVAQWVARAALRLGGRTLVLTTSLRALQVIAEGLRQHLAGHGDVRVLAQGDQGKRELLTQFRGGAQPGVPGCVLVASASFWEGVDLPGEALQLLVIDKLPFPPPTDPLVEARGKRLESLQRNVFNEYFIPEAAVSLRQGAGRLIRRESDRGVLVLCDTRLVQMAYGRRLLAALPPMRQVHTEVEIQAALEALTTASTRDRPPF